MIFCDRFIASRPEAERWVVHYASVGERKTGHRVYFQAWVVIPDEYRLTPHALGGWIISDRRGRTYASAIRGEREAEPSPYIP